MKKTGFKHLARRFLPKRIKPHRILGGPLRGRRLVTSWHDYPAGIGGYTEVGLLMWFNEHVAAGECWLDVGAHYGYTAIALSGLVGERGSVWAFEPVPETAGHLVRTAEINGLKQLHVIPVALGDPESLALERFGAVRGMAEIGRAVPDVATSILVARLDWLWPRVSSAPSGRPMPEDATATGIKIDGIKIDGVKIDVQGMELQVLHGMSEILRTHRPALVVEFHAGVERTDVLETLASAGYTTGGRPVETAPDEPRHRPKYADNCSYAFFPDA